MERGGFCSRKFLYSAPGGQTCIWFVRSIIDPVVASLGHSELTFQGNTTAEM